MAPTATDVITDVDAAPETEQSPISDEAIARLIAQETASKLPPPPRRVTFTELYQSFIELVAENTAGHKYRQLKSETSSIKVLELALMWALNNRDRVGSITADDAETPDAQEGEEEEAGPIPDEIPDPLPEEA